MGFFFIFEIGIHSMQMPQEILLARLFILFDSCWEWLGVEPQMCVGTFSVLAILKCIVPERVKQSEKHGDQMVF